MKRIVLFAMAVLAFTASSVAQKYALGDFVLLGNDKAAEGFGPVDPGSKEESSDNGGAPDTGRAFPAAALLVLAGAAGAVLALRKRKS